jgi:hypothetical protein
MYILFSRCVVIIIIEDHVRVMHTVNVRILFDQKVSKALILLLLYYGKIIAYSYSYSTVA